MNNQAMKLLFAVTFGLFLCATSASKFVSVGVARDQLADSEFSFSFKRDGIKFSLSDGIQVESLAPPRHRLFGMSDVNVAIVRVVQQPGHVIPWHVHPRGSENYATISGLLQVSMTLEAVSTAQRRIVSKLPPAHVGVIPQGLPHSVTCLSDKPCVYHIFFNTADAGFALTSVPDSKAPQMPAY